MYIKNCGFFPYSHYTPDIYWSQMDPYFYTRQAVSRKKLIGYYPFWRSGFDFQNIDLSKFSFLTFAMAKIVDGRVSPRDAATDPNRYEEFNETKIRNPHLKTLILIGGGSGPSGYSNAALTEDSREEFAKSVVEFIRRYKFDGIDIDWEYPISGNASQPGRPEDRQNFTLLLQRIREHLNMAGAEDNKYYYLTIAADQITFAHSEMAKIQYYVDWIGLMLYDYSITGDVSGHNAPLYRDPCNPDPNTVTNNADSTVRLYLSAGIPREKLVFGIPFYGRGRLNCNRDNSGEYQYCNGPKDTAYTYTDLEDTYINKNGYFRFWNDRSKVPFLFNSELGTFISYDDEESIRHKINYVIQNELAGIMVWELGQDGKHTLTNTVTSLVNQ